MAMQMGIPRRHEPLFYGGGHHVRVLVIAGSELALGREYLGEKGIVGGLFVQKGGGLDLQGLLDRRIEVFDLDALFLEERQGLYILIDAVGQHAQGGRLGGLLDDRLQVVGQFLPGALVDGHVEQGAGLVDPGHQQVLGGFVKGQILVHGGNAELTRVQNVALQGLVNLTGRQHHHGGAGFGQNFTPVARGPEFQALEIVHGANRLVGPGQVLRGQDAADRGVAQVVLGVEFLIEILALIFVKPGQVRDDVHTEGNVAEQGRGLEFAHLVGR
ncbi:hypothetical protein DESC_590062 [Desulfosarcina cetonica]|nr:hypothetical protein DESC_590062 [Desulfosarcina cetonica]